MESAYLKWSQNQIQGRETFLFSSSIGKVVKKIFSETDLLSQMCFQTYKDNMYTTIWAFPVISWLLRKEGLDIHTCGKNNASFFILNHTVYSSS